MTDVIMADSTGTAGDAEAWDIFQSLMNDDGAKRDPAPHFARLHALGGRFLLPNGTTLIVGHGAVTDLLRSPLFVRGVGEGRYKPAYSKVTPEQDDELTQLGADAVTMLTVMDPPHHTRLRGLVQRAFTPRHVREMEEAVLRETNRLLDELDPHAPIDISADFGAQFAPAVMAHLIGLPADRRAEMARHSAVFMTGADPGTDFETQYAAAAAGRAKRDIVRAVMADRRASPRDDFVTTLVNAVPEQLSEPECVMLLQIMYLGGYETTSHMIGNGIVRLLRNPDQLAALHADPSLVPGAVEEMLRIDSAIRLTQFVAAEGAELLGQRAEPGATFIGLFGAANRDPRVYPDPDRFDIRRKGRPHLAFGGGVHYCLGVNLARFELERVFAAFVSRFPRMRLEEAQPPKLASFMQSAHERVLVTLEPG